MGFVHLAARSEFSLGESLALSKDLVQAAAADGQCALGLCDVGTLAGAWGFQDEARRMGLHPILGAELAVVPWGTQRLVSRTSRVRVLAENATGWRNLVKLVSLARTRALRHTGWITWHDLCALARGLVITIGGVDGELTDLLDRGELDRADEMVTSLENAVTPANLYVDLANPAAEGGARRARALSAVAAHFGLQTVAVQSVRVTRAVEDPAWMFFRPEGEIRPGMRLGDLCRPQALREHLAPTAEMEERFREHPAALENTAAIAERCHFSLSGATRRFPVHDFDRGADAESYIWNESFARATAHYGTLPTRYKDRLNREYRELIDAGLADAVVALGRLNETMEARGVVRGPGAGILTNSMIASLLGLTRLDPLRFDLPFSLPEGISGNFPLLQLPVARGQRHAAVAALAEVFKGQVCAVGEWQRHRLVTAVEAVCRRMGLQGRRAGQIARVLPRPVLDRLPPEETLVEDPPAMAWLSGHLDGRVRSFECTGSIHVLTAEAIDGVIPREVVAGEPATQWDLAALTAAGYGAVEFSHPALLELMHEAAEWVRQSGDPRYAPTAAAPDDPEAFRLLREGLTQGIPPLESPTAKQLLRQTQPSDLESLARVFLAEGPGRLDFPTVLLAHFCAVLKAHHPVAFYAAALSQAAGDARRLHAILGEARRERVPFKPLDVNCSGVRWAPEGKALRPGLHIVGDLTAVALEEITSVRDQMTMTSLADVLKRTDARRLKTAQVEALVRAGAMDSLAPSRRWLLRDIARLDGLLRPRRTPTGEDPLEFFGHDAAWWLSNQESAPAPTDPDTVGFLIDQERATTTIALSEDLLQFYKPYLRLARVLRPEELALKHRGQRVSLVATIDAMETRSGEGIVLDAGGVLVVGSDVVARVAAGESFRGVPMILSGILRREAFQWILDAVAVESLLDAQARSQRTEVLEVDLARLDTDGQKELLEVFVDYPGESVVTLVGMEGESTRLHRKLASRRVVICPGLEVRMLEIIGPGGFRGIRHQATPSTSGEVEVLAG